jgi:hypothetical protein
MIVLPYLGSVQNFTELGGRADFLRSFIWNRVSGLMLFRDVSGKGTASVHQILCEDATFLSKVITGDESWIYSYDPETEQQSSHWKSPN